MAGSVNKVILVGNLGADPDVRTMQSGDRVVNLSLATSDNWKDKQTGERREKTEWHRVVVFNQGLVNVCENYLKKGSKLYIEGQLETRKWQDQSGQDRYTTEVVLRPFRGELTMLDKKDSAGGFSEPPSNDYAAGPPQQQQQQAATGTSGGPAFDDMEDDIPF